mgnify:CR=1 FL=1
MSPRRWTGPGTRAESRAPSKQAGLPKEVSASSSPRSHPSSSSHSAWMKPSNRVDQFALMRRPKESTRKRLENACAAPYFEATRARVQRFALGLMRGYKRCGQRAISTSRVPQPAVRSPTGSKDQLATSAQDSALSLDFLVPPKRTCFRAAAVDRRVPGFALLEAVRVPNEGAAIPSSFSFAACIRASTASILGSACRNSSNISFSSSHT